MKTRVRKLKCGKWLAECLPDGFERCGIDFFGEIWGVKATIIQKCVYDTERQAELARRRFDAKQAFWKDPTFDDV